MLSSRRGSRTWCGPVYTGPRSFVFPLIAVRQPACRDLDSQSPILFAFAVHPALAVVSMTGQADARDRRWVKPAEADRGPEWYH
jgi:hypothetical protein